MPEILVTSPVRYRDDATADGSASQDIESGPVEGGRRWELYHVACIDLDSDLTRIDVVISAEGEEYLVCREDSPKAGSLYWWRDPVTLLEGDRLIGRFVGATSGDRLTLYYTGIEYRRL